MSHAFLKVAVLAMFILKTNDTINNKMVRINYFTCWKFIIAEVKYSSPYVLLVVLENDFHYKIDSYY